MKVCRRCRVEIDTRDGENLCQNCALPSSCWSDNHHVNKAETAKRKKISRKKAAQRRREMDDAMDSLGLVKVRGAMGGTYYE